MNSINLLGRLCTETELKTTPSGLNVCSFRLAVRRPGAKDKTDFIPVTAWRQTAEFIYKYFTKGKMIAISGILTSREYTDKEGKKRTAYEVVAERAYFAGEAKEQGGNIDADFSKSQADFEEVQTDEDLPF